MSESRRERKVVTVVFCDLVGFTSRAESMRARFYESVGASFYGAQIERARAQAQSASA